MASISSRNDMRMKASYQYTATKGICKASSCAVRSHRSAGRRIQVQSFVLATVSVTVSLGAKPAQAEGECLIVYRLDTVALLHTCFPCLQTCQTHLTILPTHSRWLKVCQKTELHLTCLLHRCALSGKRKGPPHACGSNLRSAPCMLIHTISLSCPLFPSVDFSFNPFGFTVHGCQCGDVHNVGHFCAFRPRGPGIFHEYCPRELIAKNYGRVLHQGACDSFSPRWSNFRKEQDRLTRRGLGVTQTWFDPHIRANQCLKWKTPR